MIKLVISDIDGTLVSTGRDLSAANIDAIKKLKDNNIEFGVATGRDLIHAKETFSNVELSIEYLCCSGALYYSETGEILSEYCVAPDKARQIIEILQETGISHTIVTDNGQFSLDVEYAFNQFERRVTEHFGQEEVDLSFLKITQIDEINAWMEQGRKIYKFEIFSLDYDLLATVRKKVEDVSDVVALSSFEDNLEITNKYAQKGIILEKTIALKGLEKDEVAIVGDSYNDISMFDLFKYSFAPESGLEDIKSKAFHVTRSCEEDGFSEAVDYILNKLNQED